MQKSQTLESKKFKIPHTYVILFSLIVLMSICTYLIPAGEYDRIEDPNTGKTVVNSESFQYVDSNPIGPIDFLATIPDGMVAASEIIFFIFIVGGSFNIVTSTGAIEGAICKVASKGKGKEKLLIPVILCVFAIAGTTIGISEECVVFIPMGIALARALGYDAIVGAAIVILGAACGFTAGLLNPFTVGVAQGIAELPLFSGIGLRITILIVMLLVTSIYVLKYASKVKSNPTLSLVRELEIEELDQAIDIANMKKLTKRDILVLLCVGIGLLLIVYGVFKLGWYIREISAIFLGIGIIAGIVGGFNPNMIAKQFIEGAKGIVFGALVVGIARAILVVMQNGMIIDTIVNSMAGVITLLPKSIASIGMMFVQIIINFFIPSGSGQAAATMPIMTPLSDVIGITRQTSVLAYQFGDGFTNSIIPTSAGLIANLSMGKIPYEKWVKFVAPLMGIWILIGAIYMVIATAISYGPF